MADEQRLIADAVRPGWPECCTCMAGDGSDECPDYDDCFEAWHLFTHPDPTILGALTSSMPVDWPNALIDGSPAPSRVASHASETPESGLRREATAADGAARPGSIGTAGPERQERAGTSPATDLKDGPGSEQWEQECRAFGCHDEQESGES